MLQALQPKLLKAWYSKNVQEKEVNFVNNILKKK